MLRPSKSREQWCKVNSGSLCFRQMWAQVHFSHTWAVLKPAPLKCITANLLLGPQDPLLLNPVPTAHTHTPFWAEESLLGVRSCPLLPLTAHVQLSCGQPFSLLSSPGPSHEMAANPPPQTWLLGGWNSVLWPIRGLILFTWLLLSPAHALVATSTQVYTYTRVQKPL